MRPAPGGLFVQVLPDLLQLLRRQASQTLLSIQLKNRGAGVPEEEKARRLAEIKARYAAAMDPRYAAARLWVDALVDAATRGQRHLGIFVEPTSFGAHGPALRIPAAWRLALDWWIVRRGDVLGAGDKAYAAG